MSNFRTAASGLAVLAMGALLPPPAPAQVVQYEVTDPRGAELPAKLTFLTPAGEPPEKLDIKSRVPEFAARKNVVYELYGKGEVPLPAGDYRVYVSRGLEWSIAVVEARVAKERPAVVRAVLERVVDTRGYISGDLHLHTKTFSGHGDANVEERLITLCAENLEWAVATDHNYITDYRPYARRLGADRWLITSVGNEVTTTVLGHFNTFPLDPRLPPVNHRITDARVLFRKIREGPLEEVIQVNHPRWVGIYGAYFRDVDLSFATGDAAHARFSFDFDSLEVLNDKTLSGWELRQPARGDPEFDHSVREDWFNLLNRGYRFAGVGNSDSHHVEDCIGGTPRNYLLSSTDDPLRASEAALSGAVRAREVTVSSGIFVAMTANGTQRLGSTVSSRGGEVGLDITVQAAPWIDADRLVVIANGEPVHTAELLGSDPASARSTAGRPVVRFRGTVRVRPQVDTWYLAYAEGDEAPYPMLHKVTFPVGFTNPIWVDADGDGKFQSLRERAELAVKPAEGFTRLRPGEISVRLEGASTVFRRHVAAVVAALPAARGAEPLAELVRDPDRAVREAAAMALSRIGDRRSLLHLLAARDAARDARERFVLNRELLRAGDHSALLDVLPDFERASGLDRFRMRRDLKELCRKNRIRTWWVAGPFSAPQIAEGLETRYPPEREVVYSRRYRSGFAGRSARWRRVSTDSSHFLNLRSSLNPNERAAAFALVTVEARVPVKTCLLLGAKCGLEVFLNGASIHRQLKAESSSAASILVPASFRAGPNRLLVKAVVEKDEWGFSLMLPDPLAELKVIAEETATTPPTQRF